MTLLDSEPLKDGYWVKLETIGFSCRGDAEECNKPRLVIETCSTVTQTVCVGEVERADAAHGAEITALCKSITKG